MQGNFILSWKNNPRWSGERGVISLCIRVVPRLAVTMMAMTPADMKNTGIEDILRKLREVVQGMPMTELKRQ